VAGSASGMYNNEWWAAGLVISLGRGADLYMAPADATATH